MYLILLEATCSIILCFLAKY